ncbi:MAG: alpha/beta fold hydrolase [Phycisphaerae bacterium]|jgi:pimeloyl-ACP methyl ester carboxylesterase
MNQGSASQSPILCHVPTADGGRVAVKRRPRAGGSPVVLLHGIASNADHWDLPSVTGPGFVYRSLGDLLHDAGYDLWFINLRGYGAPHMRSEPAPGSDDWCVDHFIVYDLPAVVDRVRRDTGQRPFLVGASMGAMVTAGFVQGATAGGSDPTVHVVADEATASQRAADVAGAVLVEFPAALRWPQALYTPEGRLDWQRLLGLESPWSAKANYPFELMARWGWLHALLEFVGEVPLDRFRMAPGEAWWRKLPKPMADRVDTLRTTITQGMLDIAGRFTGATNLRAQVVIEGRRRAMDHMKAGVLKQMAKSVRQGGFVSTLGEPDHLYSDHYDLVQTPVLVIVGGEDRIANADVTREIFFDRVRSADKEIRVYPEIAHGEFEAAPIASERVYPDILAWMAARRNREP